MISYRQTTVRWGQSQTYHLTARKARNKHEQMMAATCWNIWKERNRRIFQDKKRDTNVLIMKIVEDAQLWDHI
jgi:recombinational DNA repair protein RecR